MSFPESAEVQLLGDKLCVTMTELFNHADWEKSKEERKAASEPWSLDFSGPFKYVVFNSETCLTSEYPNEQEASEQAGRPHPVYAGMNIKLYILDAATREKFSNWEVDPEAIRLYASGAISAGRYLVTSSLLHILRTTAHQAPVRGSAGYNAQKSCLISQWTNINRKEAECFGPCSNKDCHKPYAYYLANTVPDELVKGRVHPEIIAYRKWLQTVMDHQKDTGDDLMMLQLKQEKTRAAKDKKNRKKYAKKKASKQKSDSRSKEEEVHIWTTEARRERDRVNATICVGMTAEQVEIYEHLVREFGFDRPLHLYNIKAGQGGSQDADVEGETESAGQSFSDRDSMSSNGLSTPISSSQMDGDSLDIADIEEKDQKCLTKQDLFFNALKHQCRKVVNGQSPKIDNVKEDSQVELKNNDAELQLNEINQPDAHGPYSPSRNDTRAPISNSQADAMLHKDSDTKQGNQRKLLEEGHKVGNSENARPDGRQEDAASSNGVQIPTSVKYTEEDFQASLALMSLDDWAPKLHRQHSTLGRRK